MIERRYVDHYAAAGGVDGSVAERDIVLTYVLKMMTEDGLIDKLAVIKFWNDRSDIVLAYGFCVSVPPILMMEALSPMASPFISEFRANPLIRASVYCEFLDSDNGFAPP